METQAEIPPVAESHPLGRRRAQEESLHKPLPVSPGMKHMLWDCPHPPGCLLCRAVAPASCSHHAASRCPLPAGGHSRLRAGPPALEVPGAAGQHRLTLVHPGWSSPSNTNTTEWHCREHSAVSGPSPSYCIRSCQEGAPRPPQHHAAPMGTGRSLQRPCLGVMSPNPTCSCRSPVHKHRSVLLLGGKGAPARSVPSLPGAPSSPASTRCCRSPLLGSRGHGAARSCAAGQGLVGLLQAEGTSPSDRLAPRTAIDQVRLQSWAAPL